MATRRRLPAGAARHAARLVVLVVVSRRLLRDSCRSRRTLSPRVLASRVSARPRSEAGGGGVASSVALSRGARRAARSGYRSPSSASRLRARRDQPPGRELSLEIEAVVGWIASLRAARGSPRTSSRPLSRSRLRSPPLRSTVHQIDRVAEAVPIRSSSSTASPSPPSPPRLGGALRILRPEPARLARQPAVGPASTCPARNLPCRGPPASRRRDPLGPSSIDCVRHDETAAGLTCQVQHDDFDATVCSETPSATPPRWRPLDPTGIRLAPSVSTKSSVVGGRFFARSARPVTRSRLHGTRAIAASLLVHRQNDLVGPSSTASSDAALSDIVRTADLASLAFRRGFRSPRSTPIPFPAARRGYPTPLEWPRGSPTPLPGCRLNAGYPSRGTPLVRRKPKARSGPRARRRAQGCRLAPHPARPCCCSSRLGGHRATWCSRRHRAPTASSAQRRCQRRSRRTVTSTPTRSILGLTAASAGPRDDRRSDSIVLLTPPAPSRCVPFVPRTGLDPGLRHG